MTNEDAEVDPMAGNFVMLVFLFGKKKQIRRAVDSAIFRGETKSSKLATNAC